MMKKRLNKHVIIALTAALSAFSATADASDKVPVSPIISSGTGTGTAKNKTPNMWLTVDDSLSMGIMSYKLYYPKGDTRTKELIMKNCGPKKVPQWNPWPFIHPDYDRSVCNKKAHGYQGGIVRYDPNFPYEDNIPVDHLGNQLPLPDEVDETYKQNPQHGDKFTGHRNFWYDQRNPIDPFIYYAVKNMGVQYRPSYKKLNNRNSIPFIPANVTQETIKINQTVKTEWAWLPHPTGGHYYNAAVYTDQDTCDLATNKRRCQVWVTYYYTKMLATKSALSIAMYKYRNADFRFGYTDLLKHSPNFNWGASHVWAFWRANASPYIDKNTAENWSGDDRYDTPYIRRSQLFPLRQNNAAVRENFYKWLFSIAPVNPGTSTRETVTYLFKKIKEKAGSTGEIWRKDPTQPYHADTNPAATCRLNHNVIFTDGAWGTTTERRTVENMTAFNGNSISTESSVTLPDGEVYNPSAAYARAYRASPGILTLPTWITSGDSRTSANWNAERNWIHGQNSAHNGKRMMGIADIAFQGWATDLDGDATNNKPGDPNAVVIPDERHRKYLDKNGNMVIYKNNGSAYWQHFNDPAAWQHINTHMIGFNLKKRHDRFRTLYINAPKTTDEAEALEKNVTHGEVGLNAFQSGNKTWVRAKINSDFFAGRNQLSDAARTAITGRGMYFNAQGAGEVIEAFDRIFARVESTGNALPAVTGTSGTSGNSQQLDNSYYTTRYDNQLFTGELIKHRLFSGNPSDVSDCFETTTYDPAAVPAQPLPAAGTKCDTAIWNAGKLLDEQYAAGNREIITAKRDGAHNYTVVDLDEDELTADDKQRLKNGFPSFLAKNDTGIEQLFDFMKGANTYENYSGNTTAGANFKDRSRHSFSDGADRNILGAIMRSTPVFAGIPYTYVGHLAHNSGMHKKYVSFLKNYTDNNTHGEKEIIYVGANDGMLHAFLANGTDASGTNGGKELFAYVPNAVYKKLGQTVAPNVQVSLNDGNIALQTVSFNALTDTESDVKWQRALVGSMGGGAKGLYSLNVTSPSADDIKSATEINWEYTDEDSGYAGNIFAKPSIMQLSDGTWVAMTGNGYNSGQDKATLIVINLKTGAKIQELVLDKATLSPSSATFSYVNDSKTNGLGPVYLHSYANKPKNKTNLYDRAYAGDLQGNLWVFDLTNAKKTCPTVPADCITVANNKPLFTAKKTVSGVEVRQPITVKPKVVKHPLGYGTLVHFGTGSLFDIEDISSSVPNSLYAIWDDWIPTANYGLATPRTTVVSSTDLNNIALVTLDITIGGNSVKIRHLSSSNAPTVWRLDATQTSAHRGWKVDLLERERAWQAPQTIYGSQNTPAIAYNTVRYTIDNSTVTQCSTARSTVESWRLVFNPSDGSITLPNAGALDVDGDGTITKSDLIRLEETAADGSVNIKTLAATGVYQSGSIGFNTTSQYIRNSAKRGSCRDNAQLSTDSSGRITRTTNEHCSYISSWKQLR